jgi:hypothetical protein
MSTNLGTPVTNPGTPVWPVWPFWGTAWGNVVEVAAVGSNGWSLHDAIRQTVAAITRNEASTLGEDISTPDDLTFHPRPPR